MISSFIETFRYLGNGQFLDNFLPIDYVSMNMPNTAIFDFLSVSSDTSHFYFVETTSNTAYKFATNFTGLGYLKEYNTFQINNQNVQIFNFIASFGD